MSANVESMFSVREVPWHGIGEIVESQLTAAEAIKAAGLDWEVSLQPVYTRGAGGFNEVPFRKSVTRSDTGESIGIVGRNYVPLQNREAFSFFDNVVDDGEAKYETAGSLGNGRQVWMTAKVPEGVQVGGVDPVDIYLLLTNSHDGSRAVTAAVTPVRVVCQNTLNFALNRARRAWKVRHTSGVQARVAEARSSLELTFNYMDVWNKEAESLLSDEMTLKRFERLQDVLVKELKMSDRLADDFRDRTKLLFAEGQTTEAVRNTAWAGLNVVSEYFEHLRKGQRSSEDAILKRSFDVSSGAARARQLAHTLLVTS